MYFNYLHRKITVKIKSNSINHFHLIDPDVTPFNLETYRFKRQIIFPFPAQTPNIQ